MSNTIRDNSSFNYITVIPEAGNSISVSQPITSVIEVSTSGPQGAQGSSQPFNSIGGGVWATTSSIQITGSLNITGSGFYINGNRQFNYGAFSHSGSQSLPGVNQSASFQYDTTDVIDGVTFSNGSRLNIPSTGVYNIQFSAQLISNSQPNTKFYIWLKKNGSNISNTATAMFLKNNGEEHVAAWNWVYPLNANDYVEIAWQADKTGAQLYSIAASGNIPAVPSVIVTVTQIA